MRYLFLQHMLESLANLWLYKLRSLLTMLGVLVGTASVVSLVSSSYLATEHALKEFKNLGTQLLTVTIESSGNAVAPTQEEKLNLEQANQLQTANANIISIAPYTTDYSSLSYLGQSLHGGVVGATEKLIDIIKIDMAEGRFVSELDQQEYFCVLGHEVAEKIRDMGALNPIGEQIQVGNTLFTIVGIAKPWMESMFMDANVNTAVIIPIAASLALNNHVSIRNILFKLVPETNIHQVEQDIEKSLLQQLPHSKAVFRSAAQLIDSMQNQSKTFTLMLGAIGGISLIVGGVGVMNIMLVSVVERRREIGIRKALGAKRHDIRRMFLSEAIVVTLVGGLMGIILGVTASFIVALFAGWAFQIYGLPVFVGFMVSVLVGIFFGYYPAYKASQLDPIKTLQSD